MGLEFYGAKSKLFSRFAEVMSKLPYDIWSKEWTVKVLSSRSIIKLFSTFPN